MARQSRSLAEIALNAHSRAQIRATHGMPLLLRIASGLGCVALLFVLFWAWTGRV
jgi:hypothetical protein